MNNMKKQLVIGIDYGTDSCRAVAVDAVTGKELAAETALYPRWKKELYCDASANSYRQHPQDYIDSLVEVIHGLLMRLSPEQVSQVAAIGIDTTGSTPCLTDRNGIPLALLPGYEEDPDAMFVLWKDHTAISEAAEINRLAHGWETDYTSRSGGIYSSEWFWSKALHILRNNKRVRQDAHGLIEHCDWMPAMLTGNLLPEKVKRSRCAAGHKGMWAQEWGGYPSAAFLSRLDPLLGEFRASLSDETFTGDAPVGEISEGWAERLGLPPGVVVSSGVIDAHAGAVGAGIRANSMVKIIGTSTCDILVSPKEDIGDKLIPGISGQVDGSVIPGLIGLEAGQSAFGDIYAWFKDLLAWSGALLPDAMREEVDDTILSRLNEDASQLPLQEEDPLAVDWFNGRRSPYADQTMKGVISGITLGTTPAQLFRSLVEATAFGSRAILEHIANEGVGVDEVIGVGGISLKSPYVMQTLADVLGVPIRVARAQQAGALGAAMLAAVAAGLFNSLQSATERMQQGNLKVYIPRADLKGIYDARYGRYRLLGDFLQ